MHHVVLDFEAVTDIHMTGAESVASLREWLNANGVQIAFSRPVQPDPDHRGHAHAPVAASSVALLVVAYLVAASRIGPSLEALRRRLVHNSAVVMTVLLLVIGVVVIGKGVGSY